MPWYCTFLSLHRGDAVTRQRCTVEVRKYASAAILFRYKCNVSVLLNGTRVRESVLGAEPIWPHLHVNYCHMSWLAVQRKLLICTGSLQLLLKSGGI